LALVQPEVEQERGQLLLSCVHSQTQLMKTSKSKKPQSNGTWIGKRGRMRVAVARLNFNLSQKSLLLYNSVSIPIKTKLKPRESLSQKMANGILFDSP